ncbi:MAG: primosomal protein N', partial [Chloroflexota bacterium]
DALQDYARFAHYELAFRRRLGYPPFQPLIRLLYADVDLTRARHEAEGYARRLGQARASAGYDDVQVLGPTPGYFRRLRGRYRWQVILKGDGGHRLLEQHPPSRAWIVDPDPIQVL